MTLGELFSRIGDASVALTPREQGAAVHAVTYDSREAGPGTVFVALRGAKTDGARFAAQALAKGAIAIVLGLGLRRYVSRTALRYGAVTLCAVMGTLAAVELLER